MYIKGKEFEKQNKVMQMAIDSVNYALGRKLNEYRIAYIAVNDSDEEDNLSYKILLFEKARTSSYYGKYPYNEITYAEYKDGRNVISFYTAYLTPDVLEKLLGN